MPTAKKPNVFLGCVTRNVFFHFDLQKLPSLSLHTILQWLLSSQQPTLSGSSSVVMRILITRSSPNHGSS